MWSPWWPFGFPHLECVPLKRARRERDVLRLPGDQLGLLRREDEKEGERV